MDKQLKAFRHAISALKKKGLVPSTVDARSVKPTKRLKNIVDKFDDVLSGKATPVKLSKSETKNMKAAGYDVVKGKTIIPHSAGEKVSVSHGHAKVRNPKGIERVSIPVPPEKLDKYFRDIKRNAQTIDDMKKKDEFFAFRFFGHQSRGTYRNIEALINDLRSYNDVKGAIKGDRKNMNQVLRNVEIVRVDRSRTWEDSRKASIAKRNKSRGKHSGRKRSKDKTRAARQQSFRDSMTEAERTKYNRKAKIRMRKTRATQSKKKR